MRNEALLWDGLKYQRILVAVFEDLLALSSQRLSLLSSFWSIFLYLFCKEFAWFLTRMKDIGKGFSSGSMTALLLLFLSFY